MKRRFRSLTGRLALDPDGSARAGLVPRDFHLRTKDFLEVKRYPEIRITAERASPSAGGGFRVHSQSAA